MTINDSNSTPKHRRRMIIVGILLFIIMLFTWVFNRVDPIAVTLTMVEYGTVEKTIANTRAGTVKACRRAKLSPSVGGQIVALPIDEGDTVKAGQLLLELWNQDLRAQVKLVNNELFASKNHSTASCAQAKLSETSLERLEPLVPSGAVSKQRYDEINANYLMHQAQCRAAEDSVHMQEAHLQVAQAQLAKTRLFAPFDGVVANISAELNEFVTPSPIGIQTPPAIDLINTNCFYVTAPIDEVDAPNAELDMPVRIRLDAFGDQYFNGTIRRIAEFVLDLEKQARTVDIEVAFNDPSDYKTLLAGYSADIEIVVDAHSNVLRIPSESLMEKQVWLYDADSETIELRGIEPGLSNWDHSEIISGLSAGDRIVLSVEHEGLSHGAKVNAVDPQAKNRVSKDD